MDYLYYILAILAIGVVACSLVRLATRSRNPDLLLQYEARKAAARKLALERSNARNSTSNSQASKQRVAEAKPLRRPGQQDLAHCRTPWGWPGAQHQNSQQQGLSGSVRNLTDRLIKDKQLAPTDKSRDSIRALLEDRYGPVDRGMPEIPYQKVKRPLLRDTSVPFDQMENLGNEETHQLRKKLQFLSVMNIDQSDKSGATEAQKSKKVEFRYVELKDLKQPWGW